VSWDIFRRNMKARQTLGDVTRIPVPPELAQAVETYIFLAMGEPSYFTLAKDKTIQPHRLIHAKGWKGTGFKCAGYPDGWLLISDENQWAGDRCLPHFKAIWSMIDNWLQTVGTQEYP
jgi:hypothetical protein